MLLEAQENAKNQLHMQEGAEEYKYSTHKN
jgi:hypothetical protein